LVLGVRRVWAKPVPYLLGAAASVLFVVVGGAGLAGEKIWLGLDTLLGFTPSGLAVDRLSGLFLVLCFGVATPVCLACAAWSTRPGRVEDLGLAAAFALTLGAVAVVVTAVDIFYFLFAWECVTLGFYLMTAWRRLPGRSATPAILTVVLGKASGAALLLGAMLLAAQDHSMLIADFARVPPGATRSVAWLLLALGFAVKIGLIPVHIWLPRSYQAAPGPLRAVMAGVAVNIGFYGLWRTLSLLPSPPSWLAVLALLIGGATALLGIAHVAVRSELAQVIAYSSVENAGLVTVGFGVAMVGSILGNNKLLAIGMLAATLQMITHALAKSLLFTSAAGIEDATGTTDLNELRGVGHRLPVSGTGLAIGSLTLAGLPLTVGLVSEWFLLEALMQQFRTGTLVFELPLAIAGALVALTTGFAGLAFVRIVGLIVLGPRTSGEPPVGRDLGVLGGIAIGSLSVACLGLAIAAPLEFRAIAAGLDPVVSGNITIGGLRSPWVLQPVFPNFAILSPSWLALVMPVLAVGVVAMALLFGRRRFVTVRRTPPWRSASGGSEAESQYTPWAFANLTRKILANVLLTRSELHESARHTGVRTNAPFGTAAPGGSGAGAQLGYTADVLEVVEHWLYRPLLRPLWFVVHQARRLQNGRLDAYMAYMLIVLIAVIAVAAALG
ncbi:MAG: proton-conducting transporter membrane subunit, partial [Nakamurella sp.]